MAFKNIAIDVGYGNVKVYADGSFKFPTAIKRVKESSVELGKDEDVKLFLGKNYFVGEKAVDGALNTRSFEYLKTYSPLLIFEAVKRAGEEYILAAKKGELNLALGLSLKDWNKKEEYIKAIEKVNVDNAILDFSSRVFLFPQGDGIFAYHQEQEEDGVVVVIDIGYNTLDFIVYLNGRPQREQCFATSEGANLMIRELKSKLVSRFSLDFTEQEVNSFVFDGYLAIGGKQYGLEEEIDGAKEDYVELIINQLGSDREALLKKAKKVIVSGGGSYYLAGSDIGKKLGIAGSIFISERDNELENVLGYKIKMERVLNAS